MERHHYKDKKVILDVCSKLMILDESKSEAIKNLMYKHYLSIKSELAHLKGNEQITYLEPNYLKNLEDNILYYEDVFWNIMGWNIC